jgi:hypothetical protein
VIIALIAAIGIPFSNNVFANFRLGGDARAVLNSVSLAKMRAAANFSNSRLYVDLAARSLHIDVLQKGPPAVWVLDGGTTGLAQGDNYGWGPAGTPPPNTQVAIAQAPQCLTNAGAAIANTACIIFNSRGIPVDNAGAPIGTDAIYLNDGQTLYAVTLSPTGQLRLWRGTWSGAPVWTQQ